MNLNNKISVDVTDMCKTWEGLEVWIYGQGGYSKLVNPFSQWDLQRF